MGMTYVTLLSVFAHAFLTSQQSRQPDGRKCHSTVSGIFPSPLSIPPSPTPSASQICLPPQKRPSHPRNDASLTSNATSNFSRSKSLKPENPLASPTNAPSSPQPLILREVGRRILGEAGVTDSSLLARLEAAQNDYFKARQENGNKDLISQSFLRVNPTLKTIHAPKNTLNSAERNLYGPISRRDTLSSQLLQLSERYTALEEEFASLQARVLGTTSCTCIGLTWEIR